MKNDFINTSAAIVRRDFLIASSYRLAFFMDTIYIAVSVTLFFFISRAFGANASPYLKDFDGDYFSFVLIGIAFNSYLVSSLRAFGRGLSLEQSDGTLETIILAPGGLLRLLVYSSLVDFIFAGLKTIFYLIIGAFIFKFDLSKINLLASLLVLSLTTLVFWALGIISTGLNLIFKRADPLGWALEGLSKLLGGVYFPVSVLPAYLAVISGILPTTYALSALRKSIISGASIGQLVPELTFLALGAAVLLPLSLLIFKSALTKAKQNGSLLYN